MDQIKCMSKKWGGEAIKVLILIRLTKFGHILLSAQMKKMKKSY